MAEEDEMTFEDAVLKELGAVKDMVLKDDYLSELIAKAVGTPVTSDDIAKAVGGSALYTAQQETLDLVKSFEKQLTTMQNTQTELVKAVAALHKEVPEDEEEVPPVEVPEEEKQAPEDEVPTVVPPEEEVPEEEKQAPEDEVPVVVPPEEEVPEEEKQAPEDEVPPEDEEEKVPSEEEISKMVTTETSWEDIHKLAKRVRRY